MLGPRRWRGRPWPPRRPRRSKKPLSTLEIGRHLLVQLLDREGAPDDLTVDEEGRGGLDAELLRRPLPCLLDAVEHLLIRQALVEALLGEAGLLGDPQQRLQRLLGHPLLLLGKERLDQREKFVLAGATRQHGAGGGQRIEREFPENEADLAGVDVFLL